jgi:hypothetical protein
MLTSDDCWLVGFWIHSTTKGALLLVLQDKKAILDSFHNKKSATLLL